MKYFMIGSLLLLSACQQLMHGQEQPVIQKSVKEKIFFTTCSGSVEYWGTCDSKAKTTCNNKYQVINKFESAVGGRRELTFQCQ